MQYFYLVHLLLFALAIPSAVGEAGESTTDTVPSPPSYYGWEDRPTEVQEELKARKVRGDKRVADMRSEVKKREEALKSPPVSRFGQEHRDIGVQLAAVQGKQPPKEQFRLRDYETANSVAQLKQAQAADVKFGKKGLARIEATTKYSSLHPEMSEDTTSQNNMRASSIFERRDRREAAKAANGGKVGRDTLEQKAAKAKAAFEAKARTDSANEVRQSRAATRAGTTKMRDGIPRPEGMKPRVASAFGQKIEFQDADRLKRAQQLREIPAEKAPELVKSRDQSKNSKAGKPLTAAMTGPTPSHATTGGAMLHSSQAKLRKENKRIGTAKKAEKDAAKAPKAMGSPSTPLTKERMPASSGTSKSTVATLTKPTPIKKPVTPSPK